jgi:hypothetical protein
MFQVFYLDVAKVEDKGCCVCYKSMFQVFKVFQTYVSSVLFGCCICCYGYPRMFQAYVLSISDVSDIYFKYFI